MSITIRRALWITNLILVTVCISSLGYAQGSNDAKELCKKPKC